MGCLKAKGVVVLDLERVTERKDEDDAEMIKSNERNNSG